MDIPSVLAEKRAELVAAWSEAVLWAYPEQTARFLRDVKDPFRNPVGATIRDTLPVLYDGLLGRAAEADAAQALDRIVRLRAVQDFTAGEAVGFVYALKKVLRRELGPGARGDGPGWDRLEDDLDGMAVRAFEAYVRCRETIYAIKADEAKRRSFVLERRFGAAPPETVIGGDPTVIPHPDSKRGDGP